MFKKINLWNEHSIYIIRHTALLIAFDDLRFGIGEPLFEVLLERILKPQNHVAHRIVQVTVEDLFVHGIIQYIGYFAHVQLQSRVAKEVRRFVRVLPREQHEELFIAQLVLIEQLLYVVREDLMHRVDEELEYAIRGRKTRFAKFLHDHIL